MTLQNLKYALLYTGIVLVCQLCAFLALPWMAWCFATGRERGWLIAKGFDRVGNALTGGSDDEYLSARANAGRLKGERGWCLLCKALDIVQKGHCKLYNPPGITE